MNLDTVKTRLADLGHNAIHTVEDSINDGRHAIVDTTHAVSKDVSKAASKAASTIKYSDAMRTLGSVAAAITSARVFLAAVTPDSTMRWALRSVGLQRRPSAISRIAVGTGLVVAGAAVGAGVAMLFAPKSGAQTRDLIAKGFEGFRKDAEKTVKSVEAKAQDVVHDVEAKAQDVVQDVEDRARNLMGNPPNTAEGTASPVGGATSGAKRHTGLSHRAPKP